MAQTLAGPSKRTQLARLLAEKRRRMVYASPASLALAATDGRWQPARHLILLNRALVQAAQQTTGARLLVLMPPQHGKSTVISEWFPTWLLATRPDTRVILTAYEADFAAEWGAKVRDRLAEVGPLCGVRVSGASAARDRWDMAHHAGGMRTAGAGGAITGKPADWLIIDDPIKNDQMARSVTIRRQQSEWLRSTVESRLRPTSSLVVVMTHWHRDDLAGQIRRGEFGPGWTILTYPAIATVAEPTWPAGLGRQPGDPLWPEVFSAAALAEKRVKTGSYYWQALYQQDPVPEGGALIQREWIRVLDVMPTDGTTVCRFWDVASTEGAGDWTVGAKVGRRKDGSYVVLDVQRVQASAGRVAALMAQTAAVDGVSVLIREEQEGGSSGKAIIAHRAKALAGYDYAGVPATGDKVSRWRPFAAQCEAGQIAAVAGPWTAAWLDEWMTAPYGAHDDQCDATAGAFSTVAIGTSKLAILDYLRQEVAARAAEQAAATNGHGNGQPAAPAEVLPVVPPKPVITVADAKQIFG